MAKHKQYVYICIYMEDLEYQRDSVVFTVRSTLQKAKAECQRFYDELNSIYPSTGSRPLDWQQRSLDDEMHYWSGDLLIQRFEVDGPITYFSQKGK